MIDDNSYDVQDDDAIIVPTGVRHNVINTGNEPPRLYTVRPVHPQQRESHALLSRLRVFVNFRHAEPVHPASTPL